MDNLTDLDRLALQESKLVLPRIDCDVAWALGARLRARAEEAGLHLAIEVRICKETAFFTAMCGTSPVNADWVRRKRNTVERFQRSSLAIGIAIRQHTMPSLGALGLCDRDYADHGGGFPLRVENAGVVGSVTVSGAPDRTDHALIVEVLAERCRVPVAGLQVED